MNSQKKTSTNRKIHVPYMELPEYSLLLPKSRFSVLENIVIDRLSSPPEDDGDDYPSTSCWGKDISNDKKRDGTEFESLFEKGKSQFFSRPVAIGQTKCNSFNTRQSENYDRVDKVPVSPHNEIDKENNEDYLSFVTSSPVPRFNRGKGVLSSKVKMIMQDIWDKQKSTPVPEIDFSLLGDGFDFPSQELSDVSYQEFSDDTSPIDLIEDETEGIGISKDVHEMENSEEIDEDEVVYEEVDDKKDQDFVYVSSEEDSEEFTVIRPKVVSKKKKKKAKKGSNSNSVRSLSKVADRVDLITAECGSQNAEGYAVEIKPCRRNNTWFARDGEFPVYLCSHPYKYIVRVESSGEISSEDDFSFILSEHRTSAVEKDNGRLQKIVENGGIETEYLRSIFTSGGKGVEHHYLMQFKVTSFLNRNRVFSLDVVDESKKGNKTPIFISNKFRVIARKNKVYDDRFWNRFPLSGEMWKRKKRLRKKKGKKTKKKKKTKRVEKRRRMDSCDEDYPKKRVKKSKR